MLTEKIKMRHILLTSLPAFVIAELFFALLYGIIINGTQGIYFLATITSTAQVEANISMFSPLNIGVFFLVLILVSIVTCLEIATIIAITIYDVFKNDHIPLRSLMHFSYERIRKLFHWKTFPLFLIILFFPKEHIGPKGILSLSIPNFIIEEIFKNPVYTGIFLILIFGILLLIYNSIFLIHMLLLEDGTFMELWKKSRALTKKIGIQKMTKIFLTTILWTILLPFPILLFGYALTQISLLSIPIIGTFGSVISGGLTWLTKFFIISLPGVIFFAGITIAYIRYSTFSQAQILSRFQFLENLPKHTPRWKNIRTIFHNKTALVSILFTLGISSSLIIAGSSNTVNHISDTPPIIIAHRGYTIDNDKTFTENSINAILHAKKTGANIVEIDIYENADGTLIVSHDPNIKRVTHVNLPINELHDSQIAAITLLDGSPLPTLQSALKIAKQYNITLMIEPKLHGKEKNIYQTLVREIYEQQMQSQVMIHSLKLDTLFAIHKIAPKIPIGYIIFGGVGDFGIIPVNFFSIQESIVSRSVVSGIHAYNKKIYVWTANNAKNIEKYLDYGVDGLITDEVPLTSSIIASRKDEKKKQIFIQLLGYRINIGEFLYFIKKSYE